MIPGLTAIGEILLSMGMPSGRDHIAFRMNGIQSDPTYFALFIIPGFLISLNDVLCHRRNVGRLPAMIITSMLALAILLSFSRTAWIGTLAGILILAGLNRHMIHVIFIFFIVMVILKAASPHAFLSSAIDQNSARTSLELEKQVDSRTWIWRAYFDLACAAPWGHGMGSLEELRQSATRSREREGSTARPHNIYLSLWVESGLQTLLPFLALMGLSINRAWRIRGFGDREANLEYGNLSLSLISSMAVALFSLGGMIQLLSIVIAIGMVTWCLKVEHRLDNLGC